MALAGMLLFLLPSRNIARKPLIASSIIMVLCMLIFNSYLTGLPIVRYNTSNTLGVRIGTMPIEDFAYLIVAIILAPGLYSYFGKGEKERNEK